MTDTPQTPAQESPAPYGIARMFEDAVRTVLQPQSVLAALGQRPAPSYAVMISVLVAFCAAAYAANMARWLIALPMTRSVSPAALALSVSSALLLTVPLSFAAAGVLHLLMLCAGGRGTFIRSYQALTLLSLMSLLQALLQWFQWAWVLPAVLGAYIAVRAAQGLHQAPEKRAAIVFAIVGLLGIAGQWTSRREAARWPQTAAGVQREPESLPLPSAGSTDPAAAAPSAISGLDMLLAPSSPAPEPAGPAQAQALQQAAGNMMQPLLQMLNNPALTKNMPPKEAQRIQELTRMLGQLQGSLASGRNLSPQEQAEISRKMQSITMDLMSRMSNLPAAGPDPTQKGKR
jgi:hypothetical protein